MSSDDTVDQADVAAAEGSEADSVTPDAQGPQWANDALSADILLDEDDPHSSVMELLVGDLEGRMGAVYLGLGPMEVRALLRQLEDVQLAQQIAEWEAEGNDIEDFPIDGPVVDRDEFDDEDDEDDAPAFSRVQRATDPLAVKTWMSQDYQLFGIPVQYLLVGIALLVAVVAAIFGAIT